MSQRGKHKVFVYGTLKHGQRNHAVLMNQEKGWAKFLTEAETVQQYPMVIETELQIPFLLQAEGKGEHVEGELYEVDDIIFSILDELEGHPNFYMRLITQIKVKGDGFKATGSEVFEAAGSIIECWTYFLPRFRPGLLDLPMLKNYSSDIQFKVPSNQIPHEERMKRKKKLMAFAYGET